MATAASANSTSAGTRSSTSCCANNTRPGRRPSSTGPARPCRSTTVTPAMCGRRRYSSRLSAPAPTPGPRAPATSRWGRGCWPICTPWRIGVGCRSCSRPPGPTSYTWAEVTRDQQMESWLLAHMHALEYWGGVPVLVVPDNTKTGVTRPCRYDPDVNPTYQNFAAHYGFGVLPARPYKPRDKAVVENAVQVAQRWILAALRHRKFFSLVEANQTIGELLHRINHRPFRKRDGSRVSVFEALDKPALQPLPPERFEISEWERARVNID